MPDITRQIIQGTLDAEREQLIRDCRTLASSLTTFAKAIEENETEVDRLFTPDHLSRIAQAHGKLKGLREALRAMDTAAQIG